MGHLIVKTGVWDREKSKHVSQYGLVCGASIEDAFKKLWEIERIIGNDYDLNRLRELVEADRCWRCVVLPCNVGDIIYYIGYTTCKHGETHPDSYGCCGCYDECDMRKCVKEKVVPSFSWILEKHDDFDRFYYTSKEAAEAALKGE